MTVDISQDRIEFVNVQILSLEEQMAKCKDRSNEEYTKLLDNYSTMLLVRRDIMDGNI